MTIWHDYIHIAIQEIDPTANPIFDYAWVSHTDGPEMDHWDEDKLGPLDLAALEARCLEIAQEALVPKFVSRAQALMALYHAGLLDQVKTIVAEHPYEPVRIWYENAGVWMRNNPYVLAIALELNLTTAQLDGLFQQAALLG